MLRCYINVGFDDTADFYVLVPTKKEGSGYAQDKEPLAETACPVTYLFQDCKQEGFGARF